MVSINLTSGCAGAAGDSQEETDSIRNVALAELRENLNGLSRWEKVHAAEYLLWSGHPDGVQAVFERELTRFGDEVPYRIGIWRVLAQCATDSAAKQYYVKKILDAFLDREGKDQLHAVETLAKLHVPIADEAPGVVADILKGEENALFVYTLAGTAAGNTGHHVAGRNRLLDLIVSDDTPVLRMQGAYALRHLGTLPAAAWERLSRSAINEPSDSMASAYLLSAALITAPPDSTTSASFGTIHDQLILKKDSPLKSVRSELAMALAERGTRADMPVLLSLLATDNPLNSGDYSDAETLRNTPENADVRSAAAYAILRLLDRN